jgi:lipid-A-disaccharide synthase
MRSLDMSAPDAPQGLIYGMVAGEASGDLLAGLLIRGLKQRWPHLKGRGIGGSTMVAEGFEAQWTSQELAVRGYVEVLRHYRHIVSIRKKLLRQLVEQPPQVFIGVDAPDFNLDLESSLKAHGIPTVHMVCPSIWAWRAERIEKIRRSVDHMLCIFPFEVELLARHGIKATYVGHPLASVIPMNPDKSLARRQLGLSDDLPTVALLPGSRLSEIEHMTPRLLAAAGLMQRQCPQLQVILPAVPILKKRIEALCSGIAVKALRILEGASHQALAACDLTLVASGTATLEAALFKRPMVIGYHMNWISWHIMRHQRLQPWVGLPNILCADQVVPELLQEECSPENLAREGLAWLSDSTRVEALRLRFSSLHHQLVRDTAGESVHAIESVLQNA